MNYYPSERLRTWCVCLGILFVLSAIGMYFHFSSQLTDCNMAYRDKHFLMPPTNDEMDKHIASKDKQGAIEDSYRSEYPQLFEMVEKRDFVFDKILANVPDRIFYEDHSDYLLPYFIDADDWVAFKLQYPAFSQIYQAYAQEMKSVEYIIPEGHNPSQPVLKQMISDMELTQKIWVGWLAGLGLLCLAIYYVVNKRKEAWKA